MSTITAAPTCIHGHEPGEPGFCHPVAIVPADVFAKARAWKREHWHEIHGVGDGYSDPLRRGTPLHGLMLDAYEAATGSDRPGQLVWLRTPDYRAQRWIVNPDYRDWIERWDALDAPDQRRAMRENEPTPDAGRWEPRQGDALCFLTVDYDGAVRFVG